METQEQHDQLAEIMAKLNLITEHLKLQEKPAGETATETTALSAEQQVLLFKLDQLTLKRHAVLTASLGGVGYEELAERMHCSGTTVKLHLKGALNTLGISNRTSLLASHRKLLDLIADKIYKTRYGIGKRWWMEVQSSDLIAVLTTVKPTNNQYRHAESHS